MEKKKREQKVVFTTKFIASEKQKEIIKYCEIGNGIQQVNVATGRQVGKSTVGIYVATTWCSDYPNFEVGFFLPVYRQCKNIFNRLLKALSNAIKANIVKVNKTDLLLTFKNGSSIRFIGADNGTARGFTFDGVIVDEANFIRDEVYLAVIKPTMDAKMSKLNDKGEVGFWGKELVLSTPKQKNWFYRRIKNSKIEDRQVAIRFTSEEGGIIHKDILERTKKELPEAIYKNEYMGEFLDSGSGLFKYIPCIKNVNSKKGAVAGLDVATKEDYMSLTIMNDEGNVIFQDRWRRDELDVLLKTVTKKLKEYGNPICHVETNGVGQSAPNLLKKYGAKPKEWVTTNSNKNEIITKLRIDFNTKEITILDIECHKDELDNFSCEWKNGKAFYGGSNGFHDDTVMSLAICNYNRVKKRSGKLISSKKRSGGRVI